MWKLNQRLGPIEASAAVDTLTLDYATRTRGRFKVTSDGGRELGIFLDRGPVLRHGDGLTGEHGRVIRVQAAAEPVVTARLAAGLPLARLSYHLGNRHVRLAIGVDADADSNSGSNDQGWVRFPPDHVLEALAERLGARLEHHEAPFDPEPGAYARAGEGGHHHHHGHDHAH